jgi:hypothetical protein
MNPKCRAEYQRGVTVKIEYFDAVSRVSEHAMLETCSRDCAFFAQMEHGDKSAIHGSVLAGKDLAILADAVRKKTSWLGLPS